MNNTIDREFFIHFYMIYFTRYIYRNKLFNYNLYFFDEII